MKKTNIKIVSPLLCALPLAGVAETDHLPVPYEEYEILDYVYERDSVQNVHFFVGLETSLLSYVNGKISYDNTNLREEVTKSNINYDIFDNMSLGFGIQTDSGFRVKFGIAHHNEDIKLIDGSSTESSQTGLSVAVALPLIKNVITQPFIEFGLGYSILDNINDTNIEIDTPVFMIGLGITHNFSDCIFGTISGRYVFMPDSDISEFNASYKESLLGISLGLGYKF